MRLLEASPYKYFKASGNARANCKACVPLLVVSSWQGVKEWSIGFLINGDYARTTDGIHSKP